MTIINKQVEGRYPENKLKQDNISNIQIGLRTENKSNKPKTEESLTGVWLLAERKFKNTIKIIDARKKLDMKQATNHFSEDMEPFTKLHNKTLKQAKEQYDKKVKQLNSMSITYEQWCENILQAERHYDKSIELSNKQHSKSLDQHRDKYNRTKDIIEDQHYKALEQAKEQLNKDVQERQLTFRSFETD